MCDSLDEGGQRCAAHTRPGYTKVITRLLSEDPQARAQIREDQTVDGEPNMNVVIAHASTRSGHAEVETLAADLATSDPDTAEWARYALNAGEQKAQTARAVKERIIEQATRSALRRIGGVRSPSRSRTSPNRRWVMAAAEKEARARYTTFRRMADEDRTLRAPDGWIEDFKATGTHTAGVPADRVTAYALYRTQSTGSDFAPAHYDPDKCVGVVTRPDGFRAGDVIEEPGFRSLGAVEHEGKTIASIDHDDAGQPSNVVFIDGSSATARDLAGQYTVYRQASDDEMAQLARYDDTLRRANAAADLPRQGHIPGSGWYVDDPDSGERVFQPWDS